MKRGMGKRKTQEYTERFSGVMVRFNPYAIRKTGLIQSQTVLKIEDFNLMCAVFQISMHRAVLLVVLSNEEAAFFKRFQKRTSSINLSFRPSQQGKPISFFVRATLEQVGQVKGKQNVCIFDLSYKACPDDLVVILGDFISQFAALRAQFETYKNRAIPITKESSSALRYNQYMEIAMANQKIQPALGSLAVNRLVFSVPFGILNLQQGAKLMAKLYFQRFQFLVTGSIADVSDPSKERVQVQYEIDFAPELVEIVDDYFYRKQIMEM